MKLVVTDLDGTLLRDDKTISEYTRLTLEKCRQKGIKVAYATGRGDTALQVAPTALFDGCIRMNGSVAYAEGKLVFKRQFPVDAVRELLLRAQAQGFRVAVEAGDTHYASFDLKTCWPNIPKFSYVDFNSFSMDVEKAFVMLNTPAERAIFEPYLSDELYAYLLLEECIYFISHREAVKSYAIEALAGHWGIAHEDVVVFGDGENDIAMIRRFGTGVAMENGEEGVKAAADCCCGSNQNDGIAKWLEDNLL